MKSWKWWMGWGPVPLQMAGFLLIWALWNHMANQELEEALAEVRNSGGPVRLSELAPEPIPDEDNAAPFYLKAVAFVTSDPDSDLDYDFETLLKEFSVDWSRKTSGSERERLGGWTRHHRVALRLLLRGGERRQCVFPVDYSKGIEVWLPNMRVAEHCTHLLLASARLAFEQGDPDTAAEFLVSSLRFTRMLMIRHLLLSVMISVRLVEESFRAIAQFLGVHPSCPPSLAREIEGLESGWYQKELGDAFRGERAVMIELMVPRLNSVMELISSVSGGVNTRNPMNILGVFAAPYFKQDMASYCRAASELVETSQRMPYEESGSMPAFERIAEGDVGIISAIAIPSIFKLRSSVLGADVKADLLKIALEGQREGWPETWSLLRTGRDRFTNEPYRMRRDETELVLYSVGADKKDNGGHEKTGTDDNDVLLQIPLGPN